MIHKYCGILSAYGLGLADVVQEKEEPTSDVLTPEFALSVHNTRLPKMKSENEEALNKLGFKAADVKHSCYLNLRYEGTDTSIMVEQCDNYAEAFRLCH